VPPRSGGGLEVVGATFGVAFRPPLYPFWGGPKASLWPWGGASHLWEWLASQLPLLAGENADVALMDFAKMNEKLTEGLVLNSRKTKRFNVEKKSEGFLKKNISIQGFIIYLLLLYKFRRLAASTYP
jgi:hypothetical protein